MSFTVIATALWLGILVSISPCPLATNIAAVSFIGRRMNNPAAAVIGGMIYTLGRVFFYFALTVFFTLSVSSMPSVSHFLQKWFPMIIGPLLILTGMFLLELISMSFGKGGISSSLTEKIGRVPFLGAFLLGVIFAASFCPVSAAIYFGSFLPLASGKASAVPLAALFGLGTGVPVLVFAIILAISGGLLSNAFKKTTSFELWSRRITGTVLIILGVYLSINTVWRM